MATKKDKAPDTMRIWNQVSKTDVDHTKEVTFGRKFTAIDAHSQIMEATRLFGPVGEGWGYNNEYGEVHLTDGRIVVWCDVTMWWSPFETWEGMPAQGMQRLFGPVRGAAVMLGFNKDGSFKVPDADAYKKASTDGLTKLLSHLGFNADVFLGQFDDNKYVEGLKKEKQQEASASEKEYQETRAGFIKKIQACKKPAEVDGILLDYKLWIDRLVPSVGVEIRAWAEKQKEELK